MYTLIFAICWIVDGNRIDCMRGELTNWASADRCELAELELRARLYETKIERREVAGIITKCIETE